MKFTIILSIVLMSANTFKIAPTMKNPNTLNTSAVKTVSAVLEPTTPAPTEDLTLEYESQYEDEAVEGNQSSFVPTELRYSLGEAIMEGRADSVLLLLCAAVTFLAVLVLVCMLGCCIQSKCGCPFAAPAPVVVPAQREADVAAWVHSATHLDSASVKSCSRVLKRKKKIIASIEGPAAEGNVTIVPTAKDAVAAMKIEQAVQEAIAVGSPSPASSPEKAEMEATV